MTPPPFDRRFLRIAGRRNLYNISIGMAMAVPGDAPLAARWAIAIHATLTAAVHALRSALLLRRPDRSALSAPAVFVRPSAYRARS
ncbi:MAG: hypothetical protein ACRD0O_02575 [Acidimicrobiia bacterium]